jgi:3-dehydroquinate synthase
MIGSFFPAERIYLFTQTLESLPEREYRSGLAEVIKTALLGDRELYRLLLERRSEVLGRDLSLMQEVIDRCNTVKGRIVEADLRDTGGRAVLNLGHTFGHALESVQGIGRWTHGEAVAWGMCRAMDLGVRIGFTDPSYAEEVRELIRAYEFRCTVEGLEPQRIIEAMRRDKKRLGGQLRLVLQRNLGETETVAVEEAMIGQAIR